MNKFEFEQGLDILTTEFEKKLSKDRTDQIYERIRSWSGANWIQAAERIIADPDLRSFPHLGKIIQALSETSQGRKYEQQEDVDCQCEGGYVFYRKGGYSYVGSCSMCRRGPKSYPLVDPVSLQIVEVI